MIKVIYWKIGFVLIVVKNFQSEKDGPHVEGDFNRGVLKIEHFCSEKHKYNFLNSKL
jgi:hypothetical protein